MRALVTGASGFVGYHLAKTLYTEGYEVHVFIRNHSNRWRIRQLEGFVKEHAVDLSCYSEVEQAVCRIKPDVIGHCAAYGGFSFQTQTESIFKTNVLGTVNLLTACEKIGFQTFIHTGSSSEYGLKHEPMKETDLLEPISVYGASKAAASLYCRAIAVRKNLPIVILRLFSPFGPWDDPSRLIAYAAKSFLKMEKPVIASPSSVRDYIFIRDVMEAYKQIIKGHFIGGEIYNIGTGKQSSVKEVASLIQRIVGADIDPILGKEHIPVYESPVWAADIKKAENDLNWLPATTLQEGMEETVEWLVQHLHYYP